MVILHLHRHHDTCQRRRYRWSFFVATATDVGVDIDADVIHFRSLPGLVVSPILHSNCWWNSFAAAALTIFL